MDDNYLKEVFRVLTSNPTQQELDFLIEAYARVGYLASEAELAAESAVNVRKHEEATEWLRAKQGPKIGERGVSDETATKMALIATHGLRIAEVNAVARAKKISNLLDALRECIHAVKFLGKFDSSTVNLPVMGN